MTSPLVSVVMCSYNGIGLIERAIGSILAQTHSNLELLVSDDGSSDGTRDYLASLDDPRVRIVLQPENLGYLANKNAAIGLARGDLITQQDQDDVSDPHRLARLVEAIARSGRSIIGCGYRRIGLDGGEVAVVAPESEITIEAKGTGNYPFWFPALLVRREVYDRIGLFDPYFDRTFGDDLYWTVKANEQYPILCLPDILYDYRDSPGSITSVAGSDRKLVMGDIVAALIDQRRTRGSDDLQDGDRHALDRLEARFLTDTKLLAEKLRVQAARAIDQRRFEQVAPLLRRSLCLDPFNRASLRTSLYFLRRRIGR